MTPEQITLVQTSFARVLPIADTAATLFYHRLFELAPDVRALFPEDMREQRRNLMQMLNVTVNGLSNLDRLVPMVEALGRRHVNYGVQQPHYQVVGAALLWTLAQGLGEHFTPDVADAWTIAYTLLAGTMQAGAHQAADAVPLAYSGVQGSEVGV